MDFYLIEADMVDFKVYYKGYPYSKFHENIKLATRYKSKKSALQVITTHRGYFKNFNQVTLIHYICEEKDKEILSL